MVNLSNVGRVCLRQSLGWVCTGVCLSVCLFIRTILQKPLQLGSPNLTWKCSTKSPGNPFILCQKVKGQGHEAQKRCQRRICTFMSAGFFDFFRCYSVDDFCVNCCSKRHSCFGIDPVFMSRPTSSIRYGACAVHHTLPPHPVAICSAKRSPFTGAALPPHGSVDPLELVGFAADSPPGLPPPPPPPPGLCDDGATPAWMLLTGRRRPSTSNDNSSSTFGVGRCLVAVGVPSSRRTTGTGPAGVGLAMSQPSGDGRAFLSRTDSAPLPLSDYNDNASTAPFDQRPAQPASVSTPTPSASATSRCERDATAADSRSLKNWPHSLATTTSIGVCRL